MPPRKSPPAYPAGRGREAAIAFELLVIVLLVLVNGVFSGAEIAVVSLRDTRVRELARQGRRGARAMAALRADPERFLATVQIAITVVGSAAGAFGGATLSKHVEPVFARIPGLEDYATDVAFVFVVAVVSYLSLVLGELVPKSLALRSGERYALIVAGPLHALSRIARPLVWFLTTSSNVVLRLFGDRTNFTEVRLSAEELRQMVGDAAKAGSLDRQAGDIAMRALGFGEVGVQEVMVPRSSVRALEKSAPESEVRRVLVESGQPRVPVYERTLDNVVGYVALEDVLAAAWGGGRVVIADLVRPAYFVPATMRAVDLLRELQARRLTLAVVVDESGGLAGIVTMEDLVEELVGEIFTEREARLPHPWRREPDGSVIAKGEAPVRELNRELGLALPEEGDWTSVAGMVISAAGRIPERGSRVDLGGGWVAEVLDASVRRVKSVRLTRR